MSRIVMFSTKSYDRAWFESARDSGADSDATSDPNSSPTDDDHLDITFVEARLTVETVPLAAGAEAVCVFVNDDLSRPVVAALAEAGVRCIALRCAGFNNVDLDAANESGIHVVRVPSYSPNAVAEHTLALMLALNRRIPRAFNRVRDRDFTLDGLVGFDMAGKTAAVIGTGKIGAIVGRLLWHLRCDVVCVDPYPDDHLVSLGARYVDLDEAFAVADIVTLNCPLTEESYHLVDTEAIERMRRGVMIVNTGRGALIDTDAAVEGLKSGQIGSLALDVYEEEGDLFFEDRSAEVLQDDTFARLLTFPNVLITAHQAFLTDEALSAIATTTIDNVRTVLAGGDSPNRVG
ncbi:MAG: 2-hydroxyacid dehydrogenase [Actinomycetota bacterium]